MRPFVRILRNEVGHPTLEYNRAKGRLRDDPRRENGHGKTGGWCPPHQRHRDLDKSNPPHSADPSQFKRAMAATLVNNRPVR